MVKKEKDEDFMHNPLFSNFEAVGESMNFIKMLASMDPSLQIPQQPQAMVTPSHSSLPTIFDE